ncbi:HNH endonuclease signature motif containing protein [Blastococcus sp. CCUG 61487]|uniref:HNH endonuclease signature motif containing protein n=1 Tax=Blastococcus sp. CCUG 61487 TaxID=1840703 RepID=UPI0010C0041A|nr:HNH endonuclease signature motif containing protein [Blastococcus sp. CCUG 61487]TKJ31538.1 HNH endonuclease [Blastococcus sp. CCUG 61487]
MQQVAASSGVESLLADWLAVLPESDARLPVSRLGAGEVAAELGRIQRDRAREAAREAELILRLAELRPDTDDPPERGPGGRRRRAWRRTAPEFVGVSEFFPDEVAHAINLGRGTAAFPARRAFAWRENLPATFAALRRGQLDERRADVLADVLQHTSPELARAVEAVLLPEAAELSLAALRRRALEVLAELDADAVERRRTEAQRAADVRAYPTADGMAALTTDMTAEGAAACYAVIDALAAMAKADGDPRPIGAIRSSIHTMLLLRPADHGLGAVTINLTVTAALDGLEGASARGGEVNGFPVTAAHLRDLLARVRALGLTTPEGGSLTFALTDQHGRLLATITAAELARLATAGCTDHPDTQPTVDQSPACDCPVVGMPDDTDAYEPRAAQRRFVTTRDRRCRAPNCGQRVGMADLDHVVPHGQGGRTTCANLCCLCRSHHRLKTFARGWTFRMDPDGTLHVTSPSGITRTTRPPGLRRPEPEPPPYEPESDPPPF